MKGVALLLTISFLALYVFPTNGYDTQLGTTLLSTVNGKTLYVGGNGPGNYTRIQDAINNASNGDTVFVYNGTYYEQVTVNKSIALIGENRNTTVINAKKNVTVVTMISSDILMKGFTITNTYGFIAWNGGIHIVSVKTCNIKRITITDCIITKNAGGGICLSMVSDVHITNCYIHNNSCQSISILKDSDNITVNNCQMSYNGCHAGGLTYIGGIDIFGEGEYCCSNILVTNCSFLNNVGMGISISDVKNIQISYSIVSGSTWGISVQGKAENIEIHHVTIRKNSDKGVFVSGTSGPLLNINIHDNTISENGNNGLWSGGISLSNCLNCVSIEHNTIISNKGNGIFLLRGSLNRIIENNFMNNTHDASFDFDSLKFPFGNQWDGNYWGKPKLLPKVIFGYGGNNKLIPWINIDWHPAKEPYSSVITERPLR
jgi:parallel beta-helix repeat protein